MNAVAEVQNVNQRPKLIFVNIIAVLGLLLLLWGTAAISTPYMYTLGIAEIPGLDKYKQIDLKDEAMRVEALSFAVSMGMAVAITILMTVVGGTLFLLAYFLGKCVNVKLALVCKVVLALNSVAILGVYVMSAY